MVSGWRDVEEVVHPSGRPLRLRQDGIRIDPPPGRTCVKGTWRVIRLQRREGAVQVELLPVTASSHVPRVVPLDRVQAGSIPRPRRTPVRARRGAGR